MTSTPEYCVRSTWIYGLRADTLRYWTFKIFTILMGETVCSQLFHFEIHWMLTVLLYVKNGIWKNKNTPLKQWGIIVIVRWLVSLYINKALLIYLKTMLENTLLYRIQHFTYSKKMLSSIWDRAYFFIQGGNLMMQAKDEVNLPCWDSKRVEFGWDFTYMLRLFKIFNYFEMTRSFCQFYITQIGIYSHFIHGSVKMWQLLNVCVSCFPGCW